MPAKNEVLVGVRDSMDMIFIVEDQLEIVVQEDVVHLISDAIQGPPGPRGLDAESLSYAERSDVTEAPIYYRGQAAVGSTELQPVWRICKITIGKGLPKKEWAYGSGNFAYVWSLRATYPYS